MKKKVQEKQPEVKITAVNKFKPAIDLINEYNRVLTDGSLNSVSNNKLIVQEITNFIETRLGSLLNVETKDGFDNSEIRMLKGLLKKVDAPKVDSNVFVPLEKSHTASVAYSKPVEVTLSSVAYGTIDPIVKEALEEEAKVQITQPVQEHSQEQQPFKYKPVLRSPTQVVSSAQDVNAYAIGQASAAQRSAKFDVKKLL